MNSTKIFFAGDFCSKPSTSHIKVSDELKLLINACDIKVINFEVPLKPDIQLPKVEYERFFQNDDTPDFLRSLGFNLFSIANNHIFDWEEKGFYKTKEVLGDASFGAGTYEEAYKIKVIEVNNLKIGFFALCYATRTGVFDDVCNREGLGCAYINDLKVNHCIVEAKKELDYLFVLPHAGVEYIDIPVPEIIARYRDYIEWGADGVIATHPHCPQGWEKYNGKWIFYSLGNFFFNSKPIVDFKAVRPHWYEGLCVIFDIYDTVTIRPINVRNISNRQILLDNSLEREKHNEYLCNLLRDKDKYDESYKGVVDTIGQNILILCEICFSGDNICRILRFIVKWVCYSIKRKMVKERHHLRTILRGDATKSLFLRLLDDKWQ